ncbi:MAG: selenide, water dikinase SelD, partial [Tumebacillaceae bacterium]
DVLERILAGGLSKMIEAGCTVVGGHSIRDPEIKFGYSVTGIVDPARVLKNSGAQVGDKLILTKPIGVGIITTAIKRGKASAEAIRLVEETMATLNKVAAETAKESTVHACTDVTGFGLLGHALEMARGAQVGLVLYASQVPVLPETRELVEQKVYPGGTVRNMEWVQESVMYAEGVSEVDKIIFCDAVTSGGLLLSVPGEQADALLAKLQERGIQAASIIGEIVSDHPGQITVQA